MCILPISENSELWEKILRLISGFTVSVSVSCALVSSIIYFSKYADDNLEESIKTIFQIAAYFNGTYLMAIGFLKQNEIFDILNKFQNIYDDSK